MTAPSTPTPEQRIQDHVFPTGDPHVEPIYVVPVDVALAVARELAQAQAALAGVLELAERWEKVGQHSIKQNNGIRGRLYVELAAELRALVAGKGKP